MVKIKTSDWLRPDDVKDGDTVTIIDDGRFRSAGDTPFGREVFEIGVRLPNGEVKIMTMNRTTQRRCAEAWGDETRNWVGKKLKIELKDQNVRGVMKRVIYGVPIKEELPKSEAEAVSEVGEMVTLTLTKEEAERLKALLGKK